jgi:hypothetical protein
MTIFSAYFVQGFLLLLCAVFEGEKFKLLPTKAKGEKGESRVNLLLFHDS